MLEGIVIGVILSAAYYIAKKQLKKLEDRVYPCRCSGSACSLQEV